MTSEALKILHEEIGLRARAISNATPDWPCRKGCDHCCHNLPCLPELVEVEWQCVETGFARLDEDERTRLEARLESLSDGARPPHVCPFLNPDAGACLIYGHRPVACRTYGFYIERGVGSYCAMIRQGVENGQYAGVVWGNHEAIDEQLNRMGRRIPMREWIQRRLAMR